LLPVSGPQAWTCTGADGVHLVFKFNMKNLVILSIISVFFMIDGLTNDYIRIEYMGNSLKPMRVLWISKNPMPRSEKIITVVSDSYGYNGIVSNDEFLFIKKTINSTVHKPVEKKDHNGFKITIHENDADVYYFITRKNSDSLFFKTSAYLKHKESEFFRVIK
jgi:hypothetical protein